MSSIKMPVENVSCRTRPGRGVSRKMAGPTVTERVRSRLKELASNRAIPQRKLAKRLKMSQSNISKTIHHDSRPLTLEFLEAVAELTQIPLGELVSKPGEWKQVSPDEAALLRALRRWPQAVGRHLVAFAGFFGDEPPADAQSRSVHELWRNLKTTADRETAHAVLSLLSEGLLPPDLRAGLVNRVIAERYKRTTVREGTGAKEATTTDDDDA